MSARRFLSYVLIAAAAALFFFGARDVVESRLEQLRAAKNLEPALEPSPGPVKAKPESNVPAGKPVRLGETFAKLSIPRLDAEVYIVEGDGEEELRRGPGHLTGSAAPGGSGNCIIAGHRDTHFRVLKNIRKGDDIVIETRNGQFLYRVKTTRIVTPDNTSALKPTSEPELNLITCFPFYYVGSAPKRFVVEAQLAAALGT